MNTDTDALTLAHWLSPAFPVGAFAYSHGLEQAIADARITTADALYDWLETLLCHGSGRNDAILLRCAYDSDSAERLAEIDDIARATAASRERLQETVLQGAAFCETLAAVSGMAIQGLTYPVAVGTAARRAGLDQGLTTQMHMQAFVGNLVSAALRAMPLGQTDGQRVLTGLRGTIISVSDATEGADLDDLSSTAFLSDIAAMLHETLQPRIFRS